MNKPLPKLYGKIQWHCRDGSRSCVCASGVDHNIVTSLGVWILSSCLCRKKAMSHKKVGHCVTTTTVA